MNDRIRSATRTLHEPLPGVGSTIPGPFDLELFSDSEVGSITPQTSTNVGRHRALTSRRVVQSSDTQGGYGTDPNMITPHSPWPKTLTLYERHVIAALSDLILPAVSDEPAPSEVGIADFFDDWLSAPYDDQVADKKRVCQGLLRLDQIAQRLFGHEFIRLPHSKQTAAVDELIQNDSNDRKFFLRFRYLLVGGYFTSDIGMRLLGYRGNVPLAKPARVSPKTMAIIEQSLQDLGL